MIVKSQQNTIELVTRPEHSFSAGEVVATKPPVASVEIVDLPCHQFILDGVVRELKADPAKRFIYVEMAFFWRWFKEQDQATRQDVRELVANGQV